MHNQGHRTPQQMSSSRRNDRAKIESCTTSGSKFDTHAYVHNYGITMCIGERVVINKLVAVMCFNSMVIFSFPFSVTDVDHLIVNLTSVFIFFW